MDILNKFKNLDESFCCLITGKRNSGKSKFIIDYLNESKIKKYYIFSPTIDIDDSWKKLNKKSKEKIMYWNKLDSKIISEIMQQQKELKNDDKAEQVLLVIDDFAFQLKKIKILEELVMTARHYFINIFFTSQKYNFSSPVIRNNTSQKIFFMIDNNKEHEIIIEELESKYIKPSLEDLLYFTSFNKPYHYLLMLSNKMGREYYEGNSLNISKIKTNTED